MDHSSSKSYDQDYQTVGHAKCIIDSFKNNLVTFSKFYENFGRQMTLIVKNFKHDLFGNWVTKY